VSHWFSPVIAKGIRFADLRPTTAAPSVISLDEMSVTQHQRLGRMAIECEPYLAGNIPIDRMSSFYDGSMTGK